MYRERGSRNDVMRRGCSAQIGSVDKRARGHWVLTLSSQLLHDHD